MISKRKGPKSHRQRKPIIKIVDASTLVGPIDMTYSEALARLDADPSHPRYHKPLFEPYDPVKADRETQEMLDEELELWLGPVVRKYRRKKAPAKRRMAAKKRKGAR